jgi:adenylate cyclase
MGTDSEPQPSSPEETTPDARPPRATGPKTPSTDTVWDRIKRHKVVEWTLAYVAFAYAVLHGVQMLRETFEWPLLVPRLTVFVLLVGVPVAVTLAWYHGHRAEHRVSGIELSILIALLVVAGTVLWWGSRPVATHASVEAVHDSLHAPSLGEKSIAVLPFIDLSQKHDQEYFADGLAEETLNQLAKVPGLKVIGRTSSFQFKHKDDDLRTIGAKLGAAHIVQGSVRRSGNRVRVTAQLLLASDGTHEWSGTYDRDIKDAVQLQSEIAASLARTLEISVADWLSNSALQPHNSEAYDAYLRGLYAIDQYTVDGFNDAASRFQQAIDLDPQFLRAYEMLGIVHNVLAADGFVPPDRGWRQVREDVSQILKRDSRSVVAHALLVHLHTLYTRDWAEATREADLALTLQPHGWATLFVVGELAMAMGRLNKAERMFKNALVFDPLNADTHFELSQVLMGMGRLAEAEKEARQGFVITPTYTFGHAELGTILLAERRFNEALLEFEQETFEGWRLTGLSQSYHALGSAAASKTSLDQAVRGYADNQAFEIACAFAYLGQPERAFEWLERAVGQRDPYLIYFPVSWQLRSLESDPRYKAFLRKMNLPE